MSWKGTDNLRPLEPDAYQTGKWAYSGRNLSPHDVENLSAKGIRWWIGENAEGLKGDLMPDGRLKFPKYRSDFRKDANKRPRTRKLVMDDDAFEASFEKWEREWLTMPEEQREDFKVWFNRKYPNVIAKELLRNVLVSARIPQATKAAATFMEFSQSKPKTTVETINKVEDPSDVSMTEILRMVILNLGPDAIRKELENYKPQ